MLTPVPTVVPTMRSAPFSIDAPAVPTLISAIASAPYLGMSQFIHRANQ
jgi:hypothetical protein